MAKAKRNTFKTTTKNHRRTREIISPEGISLSVRLADRGERAVAFVIDMVIIGVAIFAMFLFTLFMHKFIGETLSIIFIMGTYFILRSFYFVIFELKWQGQTPGKRILGIRVTRRSGGRLEAGALFARNLMREVEIYIPLSLVFAGSQMGVAQWAIVLSLIWSSIMLFMPLFNKDCLRTGDMIAGTWVISVPKTVLLPEVGQHAASATNDPVGMKFHFSKKQLSIYGIYEVQTLENVLRRETKDRHRLFQEVAQRIQAKIGWQPVHSQEDAGEFLQAFYTALRRHLEADMLMGRRKENKFAGQKTVRSGKAISSGAHPGDKSATPEVAQKKKIKNPLYKKD
ncbi:RDD family protein [Paremcibacter congregatus]|uniref:RDD family protein n=1 Tax=Paremcibacter congregatus TaxID=2043170 RepID=UPI0013FD905A|nr:RDD family protein [Paremcibacter congregatus]